MKQILKKTSSINDLNYLIDKKYINILKPEKYTLEFLEKENYSIPYEIKNTKNQEEQILNIANKVLKSVSNQLNETYNVNISENVWRVLISNIVIRLTYSFWYNYFNLKKLNSKFNSNPINLELVNKFQNTKSILNFLHSHVGNEFIVNLIIKDNYNNFKINAQKKEISLKKNNIILSIKSKFVHFFKILNLYLSLFISNKNNYFVYGVKGITLLDKLKFKKNIIINNDNYRLDKRNVNFNDIEIPKFRKIINSNNEDEEILHQLVFNNISKFLPMNIFKNFKKKFNFNNRIYKFFRLNRKKIIIGSVMGGNDILKFLFFIHKLYKNKLFVHQHGGYYGLINIFSTMNFVEYKSADYFLTWGWTNHSNYKINTIPLPVPFISKLKIKYERKKINSSTKKILFVGTEIPKYFNNYGNTITFEYIKDYLNDKKIFLKNINEKYKIDYKPYYGLNSFNETNLIKSYKNNVKFVKNNVEKIIHKYDLIIIDHPSTLFNYCLGAKIPSIFLFNSKIWKFSDTSMKEILELKKLNIIYDNPKSCANYINNEYFNKRKKNHSNEKFIKKYCNNSNQWVNIWNNTINKV